MVSRELIIALADARRRIPDVDWNRLAAEVANWESKPEAGSIRTATSSILSPDGAWILSEAFARNTHVRWNEISAAMSAIEHLVGDSRPLAEIVWTGPANGRFPVRRIDQIMYDLLSKASKRVMLVTFAAHRVRFLREHLAQAAQRGVEITLIVEYSDESEGQLTMDAVAAFEDDRLSGMKVYYWPIENRERNQAGRPGKLHIKCAVIDDVAIIGSANLTDDAFNRNMELGIMIREMATVTAISDHFRELITRGVLVQVPNANPK